MVGFLVTNIFRGGKACTQVLQRTRQGGLGKVSRCPMIDFARFDEQRARDYLTYSTPKLDRLWQTHVDLSV